MPNGSPRSLEAVRALIIDAFANTPIPPKYKEILPRRGRGIKAWGDSSGIGRPSPELSSAFAAGWDYEIWYGRFKKRGPVGYAAYVPALMVSIIDSDTANFSNVHHFLSRVLPRERTLYKCGVDEDFRSETAGLTPEQRAALVAAMWLFVKPEIDWLSNAFVRAFHTGWPDVDSPEAKLFRDLHARLRSYEFKRPRNQQRAKVFDAIKSVFAETPCPGDENLASTECCDDESAEHAIDFRGVPWQHLDPRLLAANYVSLSFLSEVGFRYYIPAYVLADLEDDPVDTNADPVFHLTHGLCAEREAPELGDSVLAAVLERMPDLGSIDEIRTLMQRSQRRRSETDWFAYRVNRMAGFSHAERLAVIGYLEYRAKIDPDFDGPRIEEALERYWRSSLEHSS